MQAIRSILVVIEPEHSESLALKRAKLIAKVTDAHLHLLVCDKKHEHSALLSLLEEGLKEDGYSVTTEQAWNDSLHETIIDVQQAEGCGLVIKQHFPDSPLKKALLTPADWKLLRYCPTPVLLVKTATPWAGGVILAAIVMILLPEMMREFSEYRMLMFGAMMVLMMIWRPQGLLPMQRPHMELRK